MSRKKLIGHLCVAGMGEGCHMHLASLIYMKHVCLINRKDVHKEHMEQIDELETQYSSRARVLSDVEEPDVEEPDGNVTPKNDMEIDDE